MVLVIFLRENLSPIKTSVRARCGISD